MQLEFTFGLVRNVLGALTLFFIFLITVTYISKTNSQEIIVSVIKLEKSKASSVISEKDMNEQLLAVVENDIAEYKALCTFALMLLGIWLTYLGVWIYIQVKGILTELAEEK
jgi:uncharacterized membrane protein